jgi:hypothetical protein
MTRLRTKYTNWSLKPLLAIIYLLFFSIQFNSRYYSIASYFDYAGSPKIKAALASHVLPAGRSEQQVVYNNYIPNRSHLAIDKRYQGKRVIEAGPCQFRLNPPYYRELCVKFYSTDQDIISADLVITSLRGPPCA